MLYSLKRLVLPWTCGYIHEEETNQRPERLAGLERDGDGWPHKRQVFPLILGQAGFVRESKQKSTFSPSRREICFFSRCVSGVFLISDRVDGESEREPGRDMGMGLPWKLAKERVPLRRATA